MDLNLADNVALVTGGASGIGRAVAELFAREGANVAILDIAENVADVADQLAHDSGQRVIGLQADIVTPSAVDDAVQRAVDRLGPIDQLAHAAAMGSGKFGFPFTNLRPGDWRQVLEVNVLGMVHVAHAVAPAMIARRRGAMVFLASVAGQIGSQTDPPYSASKAANINFAQCMAKDLAPHQVRVNTVCPGMVQTPLNRAVWQAWHDQQPPEQQQDYETWAAAKIKAVVPLGQWQRPENIAEMVVFLSSDRAAHVTGQTINVDGGFVMHW